MPGVEGPQLERLLHRQGELLDARDFGDQGRFSAELRSWHNRALHAAYGVSEGMGVRVDGSDVVVEAGVAYDVRGQELVLPADTALPIPASAAGMTLIVRRRDDRVATALGAVELVWWPTGRLRPQDGVPLGHVPLPPEPPSLIGHHPFARALAKPKTATGATVAGATPWTIWMVDTPNGRVAAGFQVTIDTSTGGFTSVPCYFAWPRWHDLSLQSAPSSALLQFAFVGEHVDQPTTRSFVFRLLLPLMALGGLGTGTGRAVPRMGNISLTAEVLDAMSLARHGGISVCWLGVQGPPDHAANEAVAAKSKGNTE